MHKPRIDVQRAQKPLYDKRQINRYLIAHKIHKLMRNDMTYILGARCVDGVVLVADTKISMEEGARYTFGKKLFKASDTVVMGASGISGFFSSFQNRVALRSNELTKKGVDLQNPTAVKILAENVIRQMHKIYEQDRYLLMDNFNVFLANRIFQTAELTNFTGYGIPEPVNTIKVIGHGEPYGSLFITKIWDKQMTMEETARLALFIIKLIQDSKIDASVGYNSEYLPQVYYVPDVAFPEGFTWSDPIKPKEQKVIDDSFAKRPITELSDDDVTCLLNDVTSRVSDVTNLLKKGQFRFQA